MGQTVELMGVENAGIDLTGKRGIVKCELPGGLVSVAIDGGDDVKACGLSTSRLCALPLCQLRVPEMPRRHLADVCAGLAAT